MTWMHLPKATLLKARNSVQSYDCKVDRLMARSVLQARPINLYFFSLSTGRALTHSKGQEERTFPTSLFEESSAAILERDQKKMCVAADGLLF